MPEDLILSEANRSKLDNIVSQMAANKESDANIQFVVNDFKNKYGSKSTQSAPQQVQAPPAQQQSPTAEQAFNQTANAVRNMFAGGTQVANPSQAIQQPIAQPQATAPQGGFDVYGQMKQQQFQDEQKAQREHQEKTQQQYQQQFDLTKLDFEKNIGVNHSAIDQHKDLIDRLKNKQGTPEDIKQYNEMVLPEIQKQQIANDNGYKIYGLTNLKSSDKDTQLSSNVDALTKAIREGKDYSQILGKIHEIDPNYQVDLAQIHNPQVEDKKKQLYQDAVTQYQIAKQKYDAAKAEAEKGLPNLGVNAFTTKFPLMGFIPSIHDFNEAEKELAQAQTLAQAAYKNYVLKEDLGAEYKEPNFLNKNIGQPLLSAVKYFSPIGMDKGTKDQPLALKQAEEQYGIPHSEALNKIEETSADRIRNQIGGILGMVAQAAPLGGLSEGAEAELGLSGENGAIQTLIKSKDYGDKLKAVGLNSLIGGTKFVAATSDPSQFKAGAVIEGAGLLGEAALGELPLANSFVKNILPDLSKNLYANKAINTLAGGTITSTSDEAYKYAEAAYKSLAHNENWDKALTEAGIDPKHPIRSFAEKTAVFTAMGLTKFLSPLAAKEKEIKVNELVDAGMKPEEATAMVESIPTKAEQPHEEKPTQTEVPTETKINEPINEVKPIEVKANDTVDNALAETQQHEQQLKNNTYEPTDAQSEVVNSAIEETGNPPQDEAEQRKQLDIINTALTKGTESSGNQAATNAEGGSAAPKSVGGKTEGGQGGVAKTEIGSGRVVGDMNVDTVSKKIHEQGFDSLNEAEKTFAKENGSKIDDALIKLRNQKGEVWNNRGTKFTQNEDGEHAFVGKDGETYTISHTTNSKGTVSVKVRDKNGKTVSSAYFWNNGDGSYSIARGSKISSEIQGKGLAKAVYDYTDNNIGKIKKTETTTDNGETLWSKNGDYIAAELQSLKETPKAETPKTNNQNEKANEVREIEKGQRKPEDERGQPIGKSDGQKANVQEEKVEQGEATPQSLLPRSRKNRIEVVKKSEPLDLRTAVLKFFIEGGKLHQDEVIRELGLGNRDRYNSGKKTSSPTELISRNWMIDHEPVKEGEKRKTIDQQILGNPMFENYDPQKVRDMFIEVMTDHTQKDKMIDEYLHQQSKLDYESGLQKHYENTIAPPTPHEEMVYSLENAVHLTPEEQDLLPTLEDGIGNLTKEEQAHLLSLYDEWQNGRSIEEIRQEAEQETYLQKIKNNQREAELNRQAENVDNGNGINKRNAKAEPISETKTITTKPTGNATNQKQVEKSVSTERENRSENEADKTGSSNSVLGAEKGEEKINEPPKGLNWTFGNESKDDIFSAKNAVMDAARAEHTAEESKKALFRSRETINNQAAEIEKSPTYSANAIVDAVNNGEKIPYDNVLAQALILRHYIDLTALDRVANNIPNEVERQAQKDLINQQQINAENALQKLGTEWSEFGNFRQQMMRDKFTFENQLRNFEKAKGSPLTNEERENLKAIINKLQDDLQKASDITEQGNKAHEEAIQKIRDEYEKKLVEAAKKGATIKNKDGKKVSKTLNKLADKIKEGRIEAFSGKSYATLDAGLSNQALKIIEKTLRGTATIADAIEMGLDKIRESDWYKKINNKDEFEKDFREYYTNKLEGSLKEDFASLAKSAIDKAQGGLNGTMHSDLQKMFKDRVENGMDDYKEITQSIYDELAPHIPNLDINELRDLISGYGNYEYKGQADLTKKITALKREMFNVADAEKGDKIAIEKSLRAKKNRLKYYEDRLAEAKSNPEILAQRKGTPKKVSSPELEKINADIQTTKNKLRNEEDKYRFANKKILGSERLNRIAFNANSVMRNLMLSQPFIYGKLATWGAFKLSERATMMALQHIIENPFTERLPFNIGKNLNDVSKKAIVEGKEGQWIASKEAFKNAAKSQFYLGEAFRKLKTGKTHKGLASGFEEERMPLTSLEKYYNVVANSHGAVKVPFQFIMHDYGTTKASEYYHNRGEENPEAVKAIGNTLALDVTAMNENTVHKWWAKNKNAFENYQPKINPETGKPYATEIGRQTANRIAAALMDFVVPFAKVGSNVAKAGLHDYNPPIAITEAVRLISRGAENLTPEEADYAIKLLKTGLVGSALALTMGAYYASGKRDEDKENAIVGNFYKSTKKQLNANNEANKVNLFSNKKILGKAGNTAISHNPYATSLVYLATVNDVAREAAKGGKPHFKDYVDGLKAATKGLLEEQFLIRGIENAGEAISKGTIAPLVGGRLGGLGTLAEALDTDKNGNLVKRKATTAVEKVEAQIPKLREMLPSKEKQTPFIDLGSN